jgi:hypothetical protein
MTAGLVGVPLADGEAWGGDPWGSADVCSWGVCTGGAMPVCGGWEPRLGDAAYGGLAALGGRPRLRLLLGVSSPCIS